MRTIFLSLLLVTLFGCASNGPDLSPRMQAAYDKPLVCRGEQQCDLYWERVAFYINKHSRFKIQTSDKNLIQTYSPTGSSPYVGYNISREPLGNEAYRLWVKIWCDNMFGCHPDAYQEIANVKIYVSK